MLHHVQNAFNAGALSPYVSARPELEVYQAGCKTLRNFMSLPYGGARYRQGTETITATKDNSEARLVAFEFSTRQRHMLEFGEEYLRFHAVGLEDYGPILDGGVPLELATPYQADELRQLQFAQLNDVVIITHPNHAPRRLSRYAATDWEFEVFPFLNPPFLDVNADESVAISATDVDGTVTLTSDSDIWTADNVGSEFELAYRRTKGEVSIEQDIKSDTKTVYVLEGRVLTATELTNLAESDPIRVDGEFTVQTFGTWEATVQVHRRVLGATDWQDYLFFEAAKDRNVNESFAVDTPCELRIVISDFVSKTGNTRAVISVSDPFIRGRVKITGYTSATEVTATVTRRLASGLSTEWSESAFSTRRGWPRSVTFHAQRLWFGGTSYRPQTVWASRIDGYDDFARPFGTATQADADAPLNLPVFAEQQNAVEWMSSNRSLIVGTSAGEFVIAGESRVDEVQPLDFTTRRHTSNGSDSIQAIAMDGSVIYVQRQGRRLRKIQWVYEQDAYTSPDLSIYNEHLTRGGIVELAFQRQREAVLWGVTGDGRLVGWTYRAEQPFLAGHEHVTPGGLFESVASIYGDGTEDELWTVVNRNGTRWIERFRPEQVAAQEDGDLGALWFLDAAVEYTGATSICDGLDHLEGLEVMVFAGDAYAGRATVEGGEITNPEPTAERTLVGLFYPGELETMPIEVATQNGTSQGRMKKSGRGLIRLFKSLSGEWFTSQNPTAHKFLNLNPQAALPVAQGLADFDQVLESHPGGSRELSIGVRQTLPYPMTVLSIASRINLTEDA